MDKLNPYAPPSDLGFKGVGRWKRLEGFVAGGGFVMFPAAYGLTWFMETYPELSKAAVFEFVLWAFAVFAITVFVGFLAVSSVWLFCQCLWVARIIIRTAKFLCRLALNAFFCVRTISRHLLSYFITLGKRDVKIDQ